MEISYQLHNLFIVSRSKATLWVPLFISYHKTNWNYYLTFHKTPSRFIWNKTFIKSRQNFVHRPDMYFQTVVKYYCNEHGTSTIGTRKNHLKCMIKYYHNMAGHWLICYSFKLLFEIVFNTINGMHYLKREGNNPSLLQNITQC